jgi:hypothetical protein
MKCTEEILPGYGYATVHPLVVEVHYVSDNIEAASILCLVSATDVRLGKLVRVRLRSSSTYMVTCRQ